MKKIYVKESTVKNQDGEYLKTIEVSPSQLSKNDYIIFMK